MNLFDRFVLSRFKMNHLYIGLKTHNFIFLTALKALKDMNTDVKTSPEHDTIVTKSVDIRSLTFLSAQLALEVDVLKFQIFAF